MTDSTPTEATFEYELLPGISSPDELKQLPAHALPALAEEIRQRIIEVMAVNGGHLASGLGATELIIALHRVFNAPKDKLIWDVGHQSYPHKILTGRNDSFHTIRKYKGLCGFPHPDESPYDHFHAGHAGTAISLGLGAAKSRDLVGGDEYILPIIGDATLTCGLTLEALNNLSRDLRRFIIILNDNQMSISNNVGRITKILSRILSNPTTHKLHQDIDDIVSKIPTYGEIIAEQGNKLTQSLKNLVSPAAFFAQYGLSYIGPIDGHDVHQVIDTLERIKESKWPVIVHALTNKGHGLEVAKNDPITWHGARPFDVSTCKIYPSQEKRPTFPKLFGQYLLELADQDPNVVCVTPAMSKGSCLDAFIDNYPNRCVDVGIAEGHCVTFAGGIAYEKQMRVFASVYATFVQRALDNVFLDICLQELPVVIALDRAGIAGGDGATHNGLYDISFLSAMPNMVICQPRNGQLLKELMISAHSWQRPTTIRYPNIPTDPATDPCTTRPLGKGELLAEGTDILVVGLGQMAETALEVRQALSKQGISVAVVDPIFAKPLDDELFADLVPRFKQVVTIEEHAISTGLGSLFNNWLISNGLGDRDVLNCGIAETFVQHGSRGALLEEVGLSSSALTKRILAHFSFAPADLVATT